MGLPGTFCVVCGGAFTNAYEDLDENLDELDSQIFINEHTLDDFSWLEDIRLFGLASSVQSLRNSASLQERCLPDDTSNEEPQFFDRIRYYYGEGSDFSSSDFGSLATLVPNAKGDILFAMHGACTKLIQRSVHACTEGSASKGLLSLRAYYDALRTRCEKWVSEYNCIEWDYYGASQYWGYDRWEYDTGFERYIADPFKHVDLTTFITTSLKPATRTQMVSPLPLSSHTPCELESLPVEIVQRITEFLPALSVLSLRLSSKTLTSRLPLNQRFFRNYLLDGTLLPYVWDLDPHLGGRMQQRVSDGGNPDEYWDWRGVARILANPKAIALSNPSDTGMPCGFWNRCRVWTLIEEVEKLEP